MPRRKQAKKQQQQQEKEFKMVGRISTWDVDEDQDREFEQSGVLQLRVDELKEMIEDEANYFTVTPKEGDPYKMVKFRFWSYENEYKDFDDPEDTKPDLTGSVKYEVIPF